MRKVNIIILILGIILFLPILTWAWSGKVISIQDADTITVLREDKEQVRIRLYGIDAPESGQAFGNRATQFVNGLLANRPVVEVDTKDVDRYGRTVAVIILPGGTNLNEEIVKAGYAWVYTQYCKELPLCIRWANLQQEAMEARRGLWADKNPVPPWDWRRGERGASGKSKDIPTSGNFSGNTNSNVFHGRNCEHFTCKNCTDFFKTRDEAVKAGYRPCGRCKP